MSNLSSVREKAIAFDRMMDALSDLVISKIERDYILTPRKHEDEIVRLLKFCCEVNGISYEQFNNNILSPERKFVHVKESVCYLYQRIIPYHIKDTVVAGYLGVDRSTVIHHRKKMINICSTSSEERLKFERWEKEYKDSRFKEGVVITKEKIYNHDKEN